MCNGVCGDGITLEKEKKDAEDCDDKNSVSGDGCSKSCVLEDGCPVTKASSCTSATFLYGVTHTNCDVPTHCGTTE